MTRHGLISGRVEMHAMGAVATDVSATPKGTSKMAKKCATCLSEVELTHISPLGEEICYECAISPDWSLDGMAEPVTITALRHMAEAHRISITEAVETIMDSMFTPKGQR